MAKKLGNNEVIRKAGPSLSKRAAGTALKFVNRYVGKLQGRKLEAYKVAARLESKVPTEKAASLREYCKNQFQAKYDLSDEQFELQAIPTILAESNGQKFVEEFVGGINEYSRTKRKVADPKQYASDVYVAYRLNQILEQLSDEEAAKAEEEIKGKMGEAKVSTFEELKSDMDEFDKTITSAEGREILADEVMGEHLLADRLAMSTKYYLLISGRAQKLGIIDKTVGLKVPEFLGEKTSQLSIGRLDDITKSLIIACGRYRFVTSHFEDGKSGGEILDLHLGEVKSDVNMAVKALASAGDSDGLRAVISLLESADYKSQKLEKSFRAGLEASTAKKAARKAKKFTTLEGRWADYLMA